MRRPTQIELLNAEIAKIDTRLSNLMDNQANYHWLSALCTRYVEAQALDIEAAANILEEALAQLHTLLDTLGKWQGQILNLAGYGADYKKGEIVCHRLTSLINELSEIDCEAMMGPAEFAGLFAKFQLPFQKARAHGGS